MQGILIYILLRSTNQKSGKVKMNGIFISGGNSTGHKYEESFYAAGWAYEHYKNEKQSFTIKLGLGSITLNENPLYAILLLLPIHQPMLQKRMSRAFDFLEIWMEFLLVIHC